MRLKQIKIVNFGQFSNKTFDLPSDQINVFFGANEAGKSTTVAFIKQVMFGFHLRSNASPFFEDYTPLAHVSPMGGSLVFENDDSEYELERLYAKGDKTKRGILTVKKDGQVVPENLFFDQIQNIDGSFYADSFIFNQEMLGQVTSLSQEDLLERIYYLGAANSGRLLKLRDDFAKEAGKLFKKTGKKPEVNRLLKQIETDRDQLAQTKAEFSDYEKLAQDLKDYKDRLRKAQQALANIQNKQASLHELQKELSNYTTLLDLQKQIKNIKFDSENYQKAQDLMAQGRNLQKIMQSLQEQLSSLTDNEINDAAESKKVVQQKPQLLQWQAQYRNCLQKANQLNQEKEQLLALSPEINQLLDLQTDDIKQLKEDFLALPSKPNEEVNENSSSDKIWYIVGAVLAVIGLILWGTAGVVGIIALIAGIGLAGFGYVKSEQANKQQAAILAKQKAVKDQRRAFYSKYNLDPDMLDLNSLLTNLNQYKLKESAEKTNSEQLNEINQKVAQLAANVQNIIRKPVDDGFDQILNGLDEIEEQINKQQELVQKKSNLSNALSQDKQDLKELNLKLKAVLAQANVEDMAAYDAAYQEFLAQAKIKAQYDALEKNLHDDLDELKQEAKEPGKVLAQLQNLDAQATDTTKEIDALQAQVAKLQVQLDNLADSTAVFEAKQELANTETNFVNSSQEYLANLVASRWISRSLDLASNERFPKMLSAAKEYFALLTGGRYVDIILDKKLTVTRKDGKKREVKYLSRGTAEQLYFALKLAFIEQIKDKINLPILIDDSFVNFDDRRIGYIKRLLEKVSENNQVLIFTAQEKLVDQLEISPLTFTKGTQDA
ncbi:ATP-binding protein [Lactobacillus helveticus]|uniref:ATP-binding protein n=1 Tax=Lactobacillus helveticus TaxID=1587 RepID=UPI001C650E23|nr:AAA family ATPase [Lactobacillus helveticus]MBW7986316.1 DNA repair protein [Lactobacillus helveticus]